MRADKGRSTREKRQQGGSTAYCSTEPQHDGASEQNGRIVGDLRRRYRPQCAREAAFVRERGAWGKYGTDEHRAQYDAQARRYGSGAGQSPTFPTME